MLEAAAAAAAAAARAEAVAAVAAACGDRTFAEAETYPAGCRPESESRHRPCRCGTCTRRSDVLRSCTRARMCCTEHRWRGPRSTSRRRAPSPYQALRSGKRIFVCRFVPSCHPSLGLSVFFLSFTPRFVWPFYLFIDAGCLAFSLVFLSFFDAGCLVRYSLSFLACLIYTITQNEC